MFGPLGDRAFTYESVSMTQNNHEWGISPDVFTSDAGLSAFFRPTSVSYDVDGNPFIATMEAYDYPMFGVQFHPEKPQSNYDPSTNTAHSETAYEYNRYFADFFVDQARHNFNAFASYDDEMKAIVENYDMIVTSSSVVYAFRA